ncbi:hypothetical protein SXANM310S_03423 [Streptomyces xanthochromogenes]
MTVLRERGRGAVAAGAPLPPAVAQALGRKGRAG